MSAAPAELWVMTLKTGCVPLSDHLLRGQELTHGAGWVRRQPSSEVGLAGSHYPNRGNRLWGAKMSSVFRGLTR